MNNPLISIIIPTFNRKDQVIKAIQSVLNQSYSGFELFIVDDGSKDGTGELVKAKKDSRLKYIKTRQNGVSSARNKGVAMAQGSYIAFLDSDDLWHQDKLKKQLFYHQTNPDIQISQTQEIWIRNHKRVNPKNKHSKPEGYIFPESLHLCTITPSSVFLTKKLFGRYEGFDEKMTACEDYDLWLRMTAQNKVGLLNEPLLTKYGGHHDQLSQAYSAMDRFRIYSLGKIILSGVLLELQKQQALAVLIQKTKILLNGIYKRHPEDKELIGFIKSLLDINSIRDSFLPQSEEFLLSDLHFK